MSNTEDNRPEASTLKVVTSPIAHPADLITAAASHYGDRPAFTVVLPDQSSQSLSFEQIDRLSDMFADFAGSTMGLRPGDVLAVQLGNGLPFPITIYGAWKAGLIVTPINPLYTSVETRRQLLDSGARALVAEGVTLDRLALQNLPSIATVATQGAFLQSRDLEASDDVVEASPQSGADHRRWTFSQALAGGVPQHRHRHPVALYQYTGGTTGHSKAAIITAENLLATKTMVAKFFAENGSAIADGTALTALPLYHVFAFLFAILVYVDSGTHDVIVPTPRPISNLRPAFDHYTIDWMAGVDTLYAGLLAEDWFRTAAPRLKFAIAGGAALRPSVSKDWELLVCPLLEGYGLTETTGIVSCNPPTATRRAGTVGLPVPGCEIRITDDTGEDLPIGVAGELMVRGPQVACGYFGHAADCDDFADGWFKTGDVAMLDQDGMLTIMDRKKDMILVSGFNVYPNEIEAVLSDHAGVVEAAIIGMADERTGEAVHAYLVLSDPLLTRDDLVRHCRLSLAAYKVPRLFTFLDQLPKSAVGKVLRESLRGTQVPDLATVKPKSG